MAKGVSYLVPELDFIVTDSARIVAEGLPLLQASGKALDPDFVLAIVVLTYDLFARTSHFDNNFYVQLNRVLCRGDKSELHPWLPYVSKLTTALTSLPCPASVHSSGMVVYRGTSNPKWFPPSVYEEGKVVVWSGFASTTTSQSIAREFAGPNGLLLEIQLTHTGRDISAYSAFHNNGDDENDAQEIVLGPNTKLKVTCNFVFDFKANVWVLKLSDIAE